MGKWAHLKNTKPAKTIALTGLHSGAKGGRTPDLLTASQTRYQLRYSPSTLQ